MNLQRDQHAIPHLLASTSIYQDVAELRRSAQLLQSMKYERAAAAETETSEGPAPWYGDAGWADLGRDAIPLSKVSTRPVDVAASTAVDGVPG
jgi:hypothetical protein